MANHVQRWTEHLRRATGLGSNPRSSAKFLSNFLKTNLARVPVFWNINET